MQTVSTNTQALVQEKLKDILKFLGVEATVDSVVDGNVLRITAKTSNDDIFAANSADPLLALQHILRIVFKKELLEEDASLVLDIGNFQQAQIDRLAAIANEAADQAVQKSESVELRPMSSYERRIVHMVLSERTDVETASSGEGASRRIVVTPS